MRNSGISTKKMIIITLNTNTVPSTAKGALFLSYLSFSLPSEIWASTGLTPAVPFPEPQITSFLHWLKKCHTMSKLKVYVQGGEI